DWEGQPYDVCKGAFTGQHNAPNGETFQAFLVRVKRGVGSALTQFDSPVLIVCHGGVMRAFGGIYGLMVPARFKNCHLYEFQPAPEALPFPWDSYSYDYDESTQLVTRRRNDIYDSSTPLSDALPIQARS
ncbi:MAG: histidine phosphatase family protein, partial [Alphaproteobacteria bacterium]